MEWKYCYCNDFLYIANNLIDIAYHTETLWFFRCELWWSNHAATATDWKWSEFWQFSSLKKNFKALSIINFLMNWDDISEYLYKVFSYTFGLADWVCCLHWWVRFFKSFVHELHWWSDLQKLSQCVSFTQGKLWLHVKLDSFQGR